MMFLYVLYVFVCFVCFCMFYTMASSLLAMSCDTVPTIRSSISPWSSLNSSVLLGLFLNVFLM